MWDVLSVMVVCVTSLYVIFCVDPNSTGCCGRLRRCCFHRLPELLEYYGERICGRRVVEWVRGTFRYVFLSRNPIIMIVYIAITYGGIVIFLFRGVFVYLPNQSIGKVHIICCCVLMLSSLGSFLSLLVADPGRVTKKRVPGLLKRYKYDKQFYGKSECKTCKVTR